MPAVAEVLSDLAALFRERSLRWYVFGAQAAIVHGATRVTKDIDVTVELGSVRVEELLAALADRGLVSRATDALELARTSRVIPLTHVATSMPVDLVLAGPGLEEAFLDHARVQSIAGVSVPVASPEDIVTMKLLAARPTDREDVLAIVRAQSPFDDARVRELLSMLDEALGQSDLVASFEDVVRRARGG